MITKKNAKKWADALRSGKYSQTNGCLQNAKGHCCLGVACEIFAPKYRNEGGYLYGSLPEVDDGAPKWLGELNDDMEYRVGKSPWVFNDNLGFSFDEIADVIELVYIYGRGSFPKQSL